MENKESYSVVYQKCSAHSSLSDRFYVPGFEGYLPFLLSGKEIDSKKSIELNEKKFLFGILMALYEQDHNNKSGVSEESRPTWLYLLDVLGNGFKISSPETLFLDSAMQLGERNGSELQRRVLEVGLTLIPESSKIKADLILTIWNDFEDYPEQKLDMKRIEELLEGIKPREINSNALEAISYIGFASLMMRDRKKQVAIHLEKWINPYVRNPAYKLKIKVLLETENRSIQMYFIDAWRREF